MSVFGSRMTPERLAADLLSGLERGEIALDDETPDEDRAEQLAERVTALVEERLAPVIAKLQTLIEIAVVILQQAKAAQFDKPSVEGKGP